MRLTQIAVDNLLSFRHEEVQLGTGITAVVGPNGSGKSNLVRLLSLAGAALEWTDSGTPTSGAAWDILAGFAASRYRLARDGDPLRLHLNLVLSSSRERELLTTFIRGAVLSQLMQERDSQRFVGDNETLDQWVMETITSEALAPLGTGSLILDHLGSPSDTWHIRFEFGYEGREYAWWLRPSAGWGGLVAAGTELDWSKAQPQPSILSKSLFSLADGTSVASLPSPMPAFSLSALLPASGEILDLSVMAPSGPFNFDLQTHRLFAEAMEISRWRMGPQRRYSFATALSRILSEGVVFLAEQLRGVATGAQPPRVAGRYTLDELVSPPRRWEPHALPLRLFFLKNGAKGDRDRFMHIQSLFVQLAPGRQVDLVVQFVPATTSLSGGAASGAGTGTQASPEVPEMAVTVAVGDASSPDEQDDQWEIPIVQAGAGLWEALILAEAIASSDGRLVILDEPALNLHPGWQRLVLGALKRQEGEHQVLLITHSPYLLPLSESGDLSRILRTGVVNGGTSVRRLRGDVDADKIIREYSMSADARALLFAWGAVLVEGETELGALPVWFAKSEAAVELGRPEDRQIAFHAVGSDTNFRAALSLLVGLDIPWAVVCDGGPFAPDAGGNHIFRQVLDAGAVILELKAFVDARLDASSAVTFDEVKGTAAPSGIFTVAPGWTRTKRQHNAKSEACTEAIIPGDESFEAFVETVYPGKLEEARAAVGRSKVRQGRWVADNTECPRRVADLYREMVRVLERRGMPPVRGRGRQHAGVRSNPSRDQ